jgi:uncharacterized protein (DUF1015 family)
MITIKAFKALRPTPKNVALIAAKPYDVLNSEEARKESQGNPLSFLYVSKPEINFPNGIDMYSDEVYAKGKEKFDELRAKGHLVREETPCLYIYSLTMQGRTQTGLVCTSSVNDYLTDKIKKHEFTLPEKENDRIRHMYTKKAQPGMVFLSYKQNEKIDALIQEQIDVISPLYDFTDDSDVRHVVRKIDNTDTIVALEHIFHQEIPASYIADGHHRAAASAKVGLRLRDEHSTTDRDAPYNNFLSCLFPHDQLYIMDYNRVIGGLNGHNPEQLLKEIEQIFVIKKRDDSPICPSHKGEISMYLNHTWYLLQIPQNLYDNSDTVARLDISIFTKNILEPMLGIENQRTDKRIDFVGGIRGLQTLQERVDSGERDIAFAFYPVSMEELMSVADDGKIMPPKSTWFEPKLKSGLLIHLLDE